MDKQEKFEYWLDIAQYDLDTAEAMTATKRWLYAVFMCQQAIEKLVKGLYVFYVDDDVPRVHNINAVISRYEDRIADTVDEEKKELFRRLSTYYISNRYPDYQRILSEQIKEKVALEVLNKTKETFAWLLTLKQ